jgi:hypothetical protein
MVIAIGAIATIIIMMRLLSDNFQFQVLTLEPCSNAGLYYANQPIQQKAAN